MIPKRLIVRVPKKKKEKSVKKSEKLKLVYSKKTPKIKKTPKRAKRLKQVTIIQKPKSKTTTKVRVSKYKIDLRLVDDKLIEAISELDKIIDKAIFILLQYHPAYIVDHLLSQTYSKDIKPGGVRVFSGSRKKEEIKFKIMDLISHIHDPTVFIEVMNKYGFVRSAKEKIMFKFVENFQKDWLALIKHYKDPFPTYRKLYPLYIAYDQLKQHIIRITFANLSRIVLSKYKGWTVNRVINSTADYIAYEEDVQNSAFSIKKALGLFDKTKNKSFFSYVTGWIKEGISSSEFIVDNSLVTEDEFGNEVSVRFEPIDDTNKHRDLESYSTYIDNLYTSNTAEDEHIKVLDYFKGSFPVPNEIRILYRLLNLKNVNQ
jgi:hypothetical protein